MLISLLFFFFEVFIWLLNICHLLFRFNFVVFGFKGVLVLLFLSVKLLITTYKVFNCLYIFRKRINFVCHWHLIFFLDLSLELFQCSCILMTIYIIFRCFAGHPHPTVHKRYLLWSVVRKYMHLLIFIIHIFIFDFYKSYFIILMLIIN
jgi:hypothetical protein